MGITVGGPLPVFTYRGRQMTRSHDESSTSRANVVSLWQYQARQDLSPLAELRGYWNDLCCGRLVPMRSEIDPREISGALEYGFILERLQPGAVRFRLAGMHLSDLMGMEVCGMPLRSFISPSSRARFSALLERVFTKPEIHEYVMVSENSAGSMLKARMVILPLRSENGLIDRAIGCLTTEGTVGLAPRRFRILETRVKNLSTGDETRELTSCPTRAHPKMPENQDEVAGFAEAQTPFKIEPTEHRADFQTSAPARGHLRLVVSDTHSQN